jgi:hypothetical protein
LRRPNTATICFRAGGWRGSVFIVDDNFIGNMKEVRKLLQTQRRIRWNQTATATAEVTDRHWRREGHAVYPDN